MHRNLGVGEVIQESGTTVVARFGDDVQTVESKYRRVAADSLDVRAHVDLPGLKAQAEGDPRSLALLILADAPGGRSEALMKRRLQNLGVVDDGGDAWWASIEPELTSSEDITVSTEDPPVFRLKVVTDAPQDETPSEAARLDAALVTLAGDAKDSTARQALQQAWPTLDLRQRAAAGALGVNGPDRPALTGSGAASLPPAVVSALVKRPAVDDAAFLVEVVFETEDVTVQRGAAKGVAELIVPHALAQIVADRLESVRAMLDAEGVNAEEVSQAATATCRRARLVIGHGSTAVSIRALLRLDAALARLPMPEAKQARTALAQCFATASPSVETCVSAVASVPDEELVGRLVSLPIAKGSSRLVFLEALAHTGRVSPLLSKANWAGLDASALAANIDHPAIVALLETRDGQAVAGDLVRKVLSPLTATGLATLVSAPRVLSLFTDDDVRQAVEGLGRADKYLQRLRELWAAELIDRERSSIQEQRRTMEHEAASVTAAAYLAVDEMRIDLERAQQRAQYAETRLRSSATEAAVPYEAELRHARLDALRISVDLLAEAARQLGAADFEALISHARAKGLAVIGRPGEPVPFDGTQHELLSGEPAGDVVIVEPGWSVDEGGKLIVLRKALVRADRV